MVATPVPLPRRVLVLGGASDIAVATVSALMQRGLTTAVLAGRSDERLLEAAERLRAHETHGSCEIATAPFDATSIDEHTARFAAMHEQHGPFDAVIVAFGDLGAPFSIDADPADAARLVETNFGGAVSSVLAAVRILRAVPNAMLIVLSSMTAIRPRRANLVYGSAKAGLDTFTESLRDSARASDIRVITVRPGFVHSRMTEGVDPAPFATTPEAVATDIVAGIERGHDVVWSPRVLRYVAPVIKALPGPIWRRISNR